MYSIGPKHIVTQGSLAPVGATLMQTGQTTIFRTGDDADRRSEGRATDFFTLASNNPFGNTNRFTDELGGSTYTNNWVIDWSTFDGATVLGYFRVAQAAANWNTAIDNSLGTFGTFSGCRLPNITELNNVVNHNLINGFNYVPFSFTAAAVPSLWTSTTTRADTTSVLYFLQSQGTFPRNVKTSLTPRYIPVRTFTVTGTTLT